MRKIYGVAEGILLVNNLITHSVEFDRDGGVFCQPQAFPFFLAVGVCVKLTA